MAPSMSKEELMRNSDPLVWELGGTADVKKTERFCERLWIALNGRCCNVIIVIAVIIESLVIISELLIGLEFIQDPSVQPKNYNCSLNQTSAPPHHSVKLKAIQATLCYLSLALLTLFLIEVLFRMLTGKTRFLFQGCEILDGIIVITAFSLDVAFFSSSPEDKAKEAAVLIILLRAWRIKRVIDSIVDAEKLKLSNVISEYQREKTISENKGEVLILKVEDLEHEIAYFKEKLKKTEKELQVLRKHRKRDSASSSSSSTRHPSVTIGIETSPVMSVTAETQTIDSGCKFCSQSPGLHMFAINLTEGVLHDALSFVQTDGAGDVPLRHPLLTKPPTTTKRSSAGLSPVTAKPTPRHPPSYITSVVVDSIESTDSPESGYGSGGSSAITGSANRHAPRAATIFLFPEPGAMHFGSTSPGPRSLHEQLDKQHQLSVEMDVLDEASEIERIGQIEFDPNGQDKDIPMTSL
ncbi:uncharacterized protein LOC135371294 [Ornithodoros turicata]|uniref:uncharacterized protein LOC135371294 n=1 Tax=Ornithodoros turicata TaxID=34597 RepID=UPI0031390831